MLWTRFCNRILILTGPLVQAMGSGRGTVESEDMDISEDMDMSEDMGLNPIIDNFYRAII